MNVGESSGTPEQTESNINRGRVKWLLRCPSYLILRGVLGPSNARTAAYCLNRRISSISSLTSAPLTEIERYLREASSSETLRELRRASDALPWQGQFRAGPELYAILRTIQPEVMVETGVGSGYSTVHALEAMRANGKGRLVSIDLPNADPNWKLAKGAATGYLVPAGLRDRWELRLGDTYQVLPALCRELRSIDVFLHDSLHSYEAMSFEFQTAFNLCHPGSLLLADDALWNSAILDFAGAIHEKVSLIYHTTGFAPIAGIYLHPNRVGRHDTESVRTAKYNSAAWNRAPSLVNSQAHAPTVSPRKP